MSLEQYAFIRKDLVPSRDSWQEAINKLGFPLEIYPKLTPNKDSGFLPCTIKGINSGFEIYYEGIDELIKLYPQLKSQIGDRDWSISFRWGGDMAECACVLAASSALKANFDAFVYYPDDDLIYSIEELKSQTNECLKLVK